MKDILRTAPKNQFIFNVVTSPLDTMVKIFMSIVKFLSHLQRSLHNFSIKLRIVMHYKDFAAQHDVVMTFSPLEL